MPKYLDMPGLTYFYNQIKNKFAFKTDVSTPSTASTIAAMTNTNKVYVYTGSESGHTFGDWYYYEDGAWHSGGQYQANVYETDKTFTIENRPADAKKTGDEITDLKSALKPLSGSISSISTGINTNLIKDARFTEGAYIRSDNGNRGYVDSYSAILDYIEIQPNYEYSILRDENVLGAFYDSNKEFISNSGITYNDLTTETIVLVSPPNAKYIRLSCPTSKISSLKLIAGAYSKKSISNDTIVPLLNGLNDALFTDLLKDVDDYHSGKYIRSDDGNVGASSNYSAILNYIPIKPSTEYTITRNKNVLGALYDENYEFITGFVDNSEITTPITLNTTATTKYFRISCLTANINDLKIYEGVFPNSSISPDVFVPDVLRTLNIPVNPTNYQQYIPDANQVMNNTVYKMYFSVNSDVMPANLPFERWYTNDPALLITIGKDHPRSTATYAGSTQIFISSNFMFIRGYGTQWTEWKCHHLELRVGSGYNFAANCDYLTRAIVLSNKYKNVTIHVGSGTYDLFTEFKLVYGNDFFDNYQESTQPRGLHLTNGVKIICSSFAEIVFNYTGSNASVKRQFSPINYLSNCKEGFTLIGANIICSNCRYVLHDDPGDSSNPYFNNLINCRFTIDNTNNTDWASKCCVGGGLGRAGHVRIEGCVFVSEGTENVNTPVVSYHVDVYTTTGRNVVEMTGCYLSGGTFACYYGGNLCDYILSNNSLYGDIITQVNPGTTEPETQNIRVYKWNNVNRAS